MENFPGNSERTRRVEPQNSEATAVEHKKIEKVIQGEVVRRKKPLGRRIRETFIGGDGPTVWEYMLGEVLIPGLQNIFVDVTIGSVERMVYGESRSAHRRPIQRFGQPTGRINYNGFSQQPVGRAPMRDDPRMTSGRRSRVPHNLDEFIFDSRSEATTVLDGLYAYLEKYEVVPLSVLYELVGESNPFTYERYGWGDLQGSHIERVREGFLLILPRPELLER